MPVVKAGFAAFAALAALWLWRAWPFIGGGWIIPYDAIDHAYPTLYALAAARQAGEAAWLNPFLLAGHATAGDPLAWVFVPTFRLLAEFAPPPSVPVFQGVLLAHLLAGGLGLMLYLRRQHLGWAAALLAGVVYLLGGAASGRLQHTLMVVSYGWAPWVLLCLDLAFTAATLQRRLLAAIALGLSAAALSVNRDQAAFLFCLMLLAAAGWHFWHLPAERRAQGFQLLALSGVIALALLVPPLAQSLMEVRGSSRAALDFATTAHGSLHPAALLTLLDANAFAALEPGRYWGPGRLPWMALSPTGYDWTDDSVSHLYLGVVPLVLLVGLAAGPRAPLPAIWRLYAAALGFALLYFLGAHTPAFRLMHEALPGVSLFRRPNDATFLFTFTAALLSGFALEGWLRRPAAWPPWRSIAAALAIVAAGGALAAWVAGHLGRSDAETRTMLIRLGLLPLAGLLAVVVAARWSRREIAAWMLVALAALDLIYFSRLTPFNSMRPPPQFAYGPEGARLAGLIRPLLGSREAPLRAEIFGLGGAWQNAPMVYGLEQTLGYSPLRSQAYDEAVGSRQNSHLPERRLTDAFTGYDAPLARRLGIAAVAVPAPLQTLLPPEAIAGLTLAARMDSVHIYRTPRPAPRWMLVAADDLARLTENPDEMAAGLDAPPPGQLRLLARSSARLHLQADLPASGGLVLHELAHPAWEAVVNGRPVAIRRVARLFQAVPLPAGASEIEFRFRPFPDPAD